MKLYVATHPVRKLKSCVLRVKQATTRPWMEITMNYVIVFGKYAFKLPTLTITIMNINVFLPRNPGVCTDIMSNSMPLDCLFTLLTDNIQNDIYIYTCTNNIKLLHYVDNYVL